MDLVHIAFLPIAYRTRAGPQIQQPVNKLSNIIYIPLENPQNLINFAPNLSTQTYLNIL